MYCFSGRSTSSPLLNNLHKSQEQRIKDSHNKLICLTEINTDVIISIVELIVHGSVGR